MNSSYPRGSEWRKWDLHVHTPASKDYKGTYEELIITINKCEAEVIGINDYCTIEGYKHLIQGNKLTKILLPVVEFRMNNVLQNKHDSNKTVKINFHIIFNNTNEVIKRIENWLISLKCLNKSGVEDQLGNIKNDNYDRITVDYFKTIESLKKIDVLKNNFLVWLPYNEYGGSDDINPINDAPFKIGLINNCDILGSSCQNQIDFFLWKDEKYNEDEYEEWFNYPIPCIKGSDSHDSKYPIGKLRDKNSKPIDKYCWIKSDPTFEGLRQIIYEPEERVSISDVPEILERINNSPTKYIKKLHINKIANAKLSEKWFENLTIDINPELVAIIGNKGKGKSAILDTIGLLGNTHNHEEFSFLHKDKFNKLPQIKGKSFEGALEWEEGEDKRALLSAMPQSSDLEIIKCIPQSYLEKLCTEISDAKEDKFQQELKEVIFSHVPEQDRSKKKSLDELQDLKAGEIKKAILVLQNKLKRLNEKIVNLELKNTEDYKKLIKEKKKKKEAELKLIKKPIKISEPDKTKSTPEMEKALEDFDKIKKQQKQLQKEHSKILKIYTQLNLDITDINNARRAFEALEKQYKEIRESHGTRLKSLNVNFDDVIKFKYEKKIISEKLNELKIEFDKYKKDIDVTIEGTCGYELEKTKKKITKMKSRLDEPTKKYQDYLEKHKTWENNKKELEGGKNKENTLNYFIAEFSYLEKDIKKDINSLRGERSEIVKELLSKKDEIIKEYSDLYKPVTTFIKDHGKTNDDYQVQLDISLSMKNFDETFFKFILQNISGSFFGYELGYVKLDAIKSNIDFKKSETILEFLKDIIKNLEYDTRSDKVVPNEITKQVKEKDLNDFYNFLFGLDYLLPDYKLMLGDKLLTELSPGEKGAVLLIFYLLIDKSDIPLLIDQPEENLDNESVYRILVEYIKIAKKRRQIIMVTHNPNLAVVCDAEQIISVNINKKDSNKFSYISGGIENPNINSEIVRILEGTMPAFSLRDKKYSVSKRLRKK